MAGVRDELPHLRFGSAPFFERRRDLRSSAVIRLHERADLVALRTFDRARREVARVANRSREAVVSTSGRNA